MYHITPKANVDSISKKGLIPGLRRGLTTVNSQEAKSYVWLTDCPEYILETQAGEKWVEQYSPVILEIDIHGLDVKQKITNAYSDGLRIVKHEYYVCDAIDPIRIKQKFTGC